MSINNSKNINSNVLTFLHGLPIVALMSIGRGGSDYFQSLMDGHEQIITFNGHFLLHSDFLNTSRTFHFGIPEDIIDEFIGNFIYKLSSRYDYQEKKDQLGKNSDQFIEIDRTNFRKYFLEIIGSSPMTGRNLLLAIYGAYHLSLGYNIFEARVILAHPHLKFELEFFFKDFPYSKIIAMTRDPRENILSAADSFRYFYSNTHNNLEFFNSVYKSIYLDSNYLNSYRVDTRIIRLEDLPRPDILRSIASWLGVDYHDSMLKPTWGGLEWGADRLSLKIPKKIWTSDRTYNEWRDKFSYFDKLFLNFFYGRLVDKYDYKTDKLKLIEKIAIPLIIFLPNKFERELFSPKSFIKNYRTSSFSQKINIFLSPFFYISRVIFFYQILLNPNKHPFGPLNFFRKKDYID